MTNEIKLLMLHQRLSKLRASEKNIKCPGVCRKIRRKIRNLGGCADEN